MVIFINTDRAPTSIQSKIESGAVQHFRCKSLDEVDEVYLKIRQGKLERPQYVVLDSITSFADKVRRNITGIIPMDASLSANLARATPSQRDWGDMSDRVARVIDRFIDLEIPFIITAHEGERKSEDFGGQGGDKKIAPDLNPALLGPLLRAATSVVRLTALEDSVDGHPRGTRVLRLWGSERVYAGVSSEHPVPELLFLEPPPADNLSKLISVIGPFELLVIYAAPKLGKTTLVCSSAIADAQITPINTKTVTSNVTKKD